MTDPLPTVWPAEAHTFAKHAILSHYLQAWLPILTRQSHRLGRRIGASQSREILFIDGFAGPGEYIGKEFGSPVIALEAAINHNQSFLVPVRMLFIEQRPDRFAHLQRVLAPILKQAHSSPNLPAVDAHKGIATLS